jgi:zinc finger protein
MAKDTVDKEMCPMCRQKTLTLMEDETEVPYFGKLFVFSMSCSNCKFHKADVEASEQKEPTKFTFEISSEKDMKVRVVKSSGATIKIPHMATVTPGPGSEGYVTNIEGILTRIKENIEKARDMEEDPSAKKKAKNQLKKLMKVMWGQEKMKIIIEDPTGNSAIISDKAEKSKL